MYVIFFIELDMSNESIEEAEIDHPGNVMKAKERLLSDWLKRETDGANVVRIVLAFQECRQLDWRRLIGLLQKTRG